MIDPNEIIQNFEENFKKMSYEEREAYLKDMGFSFGTPERSQKTFVSAKGVRPTVRTYTQGSRVAMAGYATKRKKNGPDTVRVGVRAAKSKA